jgi:WS/DGAT/MGAT family acyltransferase
LACLGTHDASGRGAGKAAIHWPPTRLPLVPRYRQKAHQLPLDLGQPVWVNDPRFDLAYHVRRTALPTPGDEAALCRLVGRIMSQRLDRDRQLWECWVVEGLAEGRWAILTKVHHCMADGVSGNELYRIVFDGSPIPSGPVKDTMRPTPEPTALRLAFDAVGDLVRIPVEQVRLFARGLSAPSMLVGMTAQTARGLARLAGPRFHTRKGRREHHRQPHLDDAALAARRRGGSGRTPANRAPSNAGVES